MEPMYGTRPTREPRPGGKIVRPRRSDRRRTPYDRPPLPASPPESPNWLSRLILSPTRKVATGAGKLLASVFVSDSSSSSEEEKDNSVSDYDVDENQDNSLSSPVDETREENRLVNDAQSGLWRKQTKQVIQQLLMQENFSREECDGLVSIIKSRVVDGPVIADEDERRPGGEAVMEARKWLEEKKSGASSKGKLDHRSSILKSCMSAHVTEPEAGSPADVAKSYMQARPRGVSPSTFPVDFRSPSSLKRSSPSTGSWSIQEELRKVRSKATEEMLKNISSPKVDYSVSSLKYKHSTDDLLDGTPDTVGREKMQNGQNALSATLNLAGDSRGFPVIQDVQENIVDGLPDPVPICSKCDEVLVANQGVDGGGATSPESLSDPKVGIGDHLKKADAMNCSESKEVDGILSVSAYNGSQSSNHLAKAEKSAANRLATIDMDGTGNASNRNGSPSFKHGVDPELKPAGQSDEANNRNDPGNFSLTASIASIDDEETAPEATTLKKKEATPNEDESLTLNSSSSPQEGLMEDDTQSGTKSGHEASPGGRAAARVKREKAGTGGRVLRPRKR